MDNCNVQILSNYSYSFMQSLSDVAKSNAKSNYIYNSSTIIKSFLIYSLQIQEIMISRIISLLDTMVSLKN